MDGIQRGIAKGSASSPQLKWREKHHGLGFFLRSVPELVKGSGSGFGTCSGAYSNNNSIPLNKHLNDIIHTTRL